MPDSIITFEQPLNEYVRVCLRLEHLFADINQHINGQNQWETRIAVSAMLEALNVIDRPDLKSKISKALTQHAHALSQLEEKPNVDREKLGEILTELVQLTDNLYKNQDKMGHNLRSNSFLNSIRQHMANPGGASAFSTPAYHLWLQQPAEVRQRHLSEWYSEFDQINVAVKLLLQLTRGSTMPQSLIATQGFYQQALDPKFAYHLVRVSVPLKLQIYPEISVGKHRLSVRFLELNVADRACQSMEDIPFELTCCLPLVNIS
ncbi:MAG TPA: cell division protein ZapD [Gammaproteobacteria bacterium]|nr:cell division protein ZapD [Gammaproteobacteria bacterium]